jgi:plastocyanin
VKKILPLAIIIAILIAGGLVYFTTRHFTNKYLTDSNGTASKPGAAQCQGRHATHQVRIQNDAMVPEHTQASLCDKLTITNKDPALRLVAFGPHDEHVAYDGVTEQPLEQNKSLTITLNQPGNYQFHDHLEDIAHGTFTVTK